MGLSNKFFPERKSFFNILRQLSNHTSCLVISRDSQKT